MNSLQLACRVYAIDKSLQSQVTNFLTQVPLNTSQHYSEYITSNDKPIDLSIVIKNRNENSYGHLMTLWIDHAKVIYDREEGPKPVRYYGEYEIQLISGKPLFENHLVIYGPKVIDSKIKKALRFYLRNEGMEKSPDALRLLRVELKSNIDLIMKQYPDLQHFCTEDNPDDRIRGVVVKGNQLEQTDMYERFVKDSETSGSINFLGITLDDNRLIYVGSDGSIYSRYSFKGEEKIRVVYDLYSKFKKLEIFVNSLDNYNN